MLLVTCLPFLVGAVAPMASFTIDVNRQTPISPYVYGANNVDWEKLRTPFPLIRQGGNRLTAYNWETNASNAGNDYRYQNDGYLGETNEPGWTVRTYLQPGQAHGAAVLLTVPTAGRVSADKGPDNDVNRTPNYLETRFHRSLARKPGGKFVYPPDVTDRFVYQDEFVAWVEKLKKSTTPVWYSLDNEPDLWAGTHVRIVPKAPGYAELLANNIEFGTAIKAVAPRSFVFGPANYGWMGFRTLQDAPDANGRDFLDFYLDGMKAAEAKAGRRILDALDIHWYPEAQGDGVRIVMGKDKPGTPAARIQASRSLWDPTYVETSWIADSIGKKPIVLLPNVLAQIRKHYPGTKLSISEYDFGGGQHPSGTIAEADVLGIFGRQGVFAACHWGIAEDRPAQIAGFRAFLNFDGQGARFGELGLGVSGETAAEDAVYAALDAKNPKRLTLVAINKTATPRSMTFALKGFDGKSVRAFVAQSDSPFSPKAGVAAINNGTVSLRAEPMSVTTIEVTR